MLLGAGMEEGVNRCLGLEYEVIEEQVGMWFQIGGWTIVCAHSFFEQSNWLSSQCCYFCVKFAIEYNIWTNVTLTEVLDFRILPKNMRVIIE